MTLDQMHTRAKVSSETTGGTGTSIQSPEGRGAWLTPRPADRAARAVERTIPFQLVCQALATTWYATSGHHPADIEDHRARAPWYTTKSQPSTADMTALLRRVVIAARFRASHPDQPTPEEIHAIRLA